MQPSVLDELKGHVHRTWWALVIAFWALFAGVVEIVHAIELKPGMKHRWVLLLSGLVGVAFGIAALVYYPVLSLTFAVLWVAWWLMLTGILGISGAFRLRSVVHV
jgi:uncharacterized membrane protein HdeD (DUF308 family)